MKGIFYITLLFVGILFSQCTKEKANCEKSFPDWCNTVDISTAYDPVCGCDGKTYQNGGVATCYAGVPSYKKGACR